MYFKSDAHSKISKDKYNIVNTLYKKNLKNKRR